jgi:hypothetical protein
MNAEDAKVTVREDAVLEKFEGPIEDGVVVERVYLTDGFITKHEYLENGEVVKTVEGGNNGTN